MFHSIGLLFLLIQIHPNLPSVLKNPFIAQPYDTESDRAYFYDMDSPKLEFARNRRSFWWKDHATTADRPTTKPMFDLDHLGEDRNEDNVYYNNDMYEKVPKATNQPYRAVKKKIPGRNGMLDMSHCEYVEDFDSSFDAKPKYDQKSQVNPYFYGLPNKIDYYSRNYSDPMVCNNGQSGEERASRAPANPPWDACKDQFEPARQSGYQPYRLSSTSANPAEEVDPCKNPEPRVDAPQTPPQPDGNPGEEHQQHRVISGDEVGAVRSVLRYLGQSLVSRNYEQNRPFSREVINDYLNDIYSIQDSIKAYPEKLRLNASLARKRFQK